MKIEINYETFKDWKNIYTRDSITAELWNKIEESQRKESIIRDKDTMIDDLFEQIDKLKIRLKKLRKASK